MSLNHIIGKAAGASTTDMDEGLRQALISMCELTAEQVAEIDAKVNPLEFGYRSFADAAFSLGFISRQDISAALDRLHVEPRPSRSARGIVPVRRITPPGKSLVVVPGAHVWPSTQLSIVHAPDSAHSEEVRALRTRLSLAKGKERRGEVMAILGCTSGEGRSRLAAELAIAFAQLERKTLLIDADLRQPSQHALFCAANDYGLSNTLSSDALPKVCTVNGLPNLSVMFAGPSVPNPLDLLSGSRLQNLIRYCRREYAYTLIDTPPMGQYSDALTIGRAAGAALLVCRENSTTVAALEDALKGLQLAQANVLGAVVNRF